jgi:hypothetical protein
MQPDTYELVVSESVYNSSSTQIIQVADIKDKLTLVCPNETTEYSEFSCFININIPIEYAPFIVNISLANSSELAPISFKFNETSNVYEKVMFKKAGDYELVAVESMYGTNFSQKISVAKRLSKIIFHSS